MTGGSLYLDQLIHNSSNCNIKLGIPNDGPIIVRIPLNIEISDDSFKISNIFPLTLALCDCAQYSLVGLLFIFVISSQY